MKKILLGNKVETSTIGLGCMRIASLNKAQAEIVIKTALEEGINFFDHADIYGQGAAEELFSKAINMHDSIRENIVLQSKCGIVPGKMYDFSKEHILRSVDGILKRLDTDYLDILLLHRPDTLMEPEEVAEAFQKLHDCGKVKYFGVSNHNPLQIELLNKYLGENKIIINQMQFGIMHTPMIDEGLNVNTMFDTAINRTGGILEYCRLKDIFIQAWSPYQYGFFEGAFLNSDKFPNLNRTINKVAQKYGVSNTTIATAWILRHPAKMQPIVGSMNPNRIRDIAKASNIKLTREEWYEIYISAGNELP